MKNVRAEIDRLINRVRRGQLLIDMREHGYKSHMWQLLKRTMATPIAKCIWANSGNCGLECLEAIYFADLTGGEHSYIEGHGGKDLDLILYTPCNIDREKLEDTLEKCIENVVDLLLSETLARNPKTLLGIPNIIEIHIVRGKKDLPYYNMIRYNSRTLTRIL